LAEFQKNRIAANLLVIKGAAHGFQGEDEQRAAAARDAWFEEHLLKKNDPAASKP
jgi:dienelactone hydrolase